MADLRFPVGVQTFRYIIEGGYEYVDKTGYIPELCRNKFVFLGRPRRFGKSLLLSTLKEYFEGNRELFRGLAIDRLEPGEWTSYPVFHIDLNGQNYSMPGSAESNLNRQIAEYEHKYKLTSPKGTLSDRFITLVKEATRQSGQHAVILIDEYDKPLTDNILDEDLFGCHQSELRGFYSSLKSLDPYIRFAMLTGVTKFGKLNVFSGLNNLKDISLNSKFAAICGITEDELHQYFEPGVARLADAEGCSLGEAYGKLKRLYDGYHFAWPSPDIYNPFSLVYALDDCKLGEYWFDTGTPKMLVDLIVKNNIPLRRIEEQRSTESDLGDITRFGDSPISLLYQTGYLTIKSRIPGTDIYNLRYPNEEVEKGFMRSFVMDFVKPKGESFSISVWSFYESLAAGDAEQFMQQLKAFCASIPFDLRKRQRYESFWQTVMYVVFTMIGYYCEAEQHTSEGSIDVVVKTPGQIYVIELKMTEGSEKEDAEEHDVDRSLQEAKHQIEEKGYAEKFGADGRRVIRIAAVFTQRRPRLAAWRIY